MSNPPKLTERHIRDSFPQQTYFRGADYYENNQVVYIARRGNQIEARVLDNEGNAYDVSIQLDDNDNEILHAHCACSYEDWGKHCVAALLVYVREPEMVQTKTPLSTLLEGLDATQLTQLLLNLSTTVPKAAEQIEQFVRNVQQASTTPPAVEQLPINIDMKALRRRATYSQEIPFILDEIDERLQAGQVDIALTMLQAMTEVHVDNWADEEKRYSDYDYEYDDYDDGEFDRIDALWARTVLRVDITPERQQHWLDHFATWNEELEEFTDYGFDVASRVVEYGWDYPPLQNVLKGESDEWAFSEDDVTAGVVEAYLDALDAAQNYNAYLNLAKNAERHLAYCLMLVKQQQFEPALNYALAHFSDPHDALRLAEAFAHHHQQHYGLSIAEQVLASTQEASGYMNNHRRATLAEWLYEQAQQAGNHHLSLYAAEQRCRAQPSVSHFAAVKTLVGTGQTDVCAQLLTWLETHGPLSSGHFDVLVAENRVSAAIALLEKHPVYDKAIMINVVNAAVNVDPEWAIKIATDNATKIIEPGKAQYYHNAADWLVRAKQAYAVMGKAVEWEQYYNTLRTKHARKYKLMAAFKQVGL